MEAIQSDQSQHQFLNLEDNVFTEYKGKIYIGKDEVTGNLKSILQSEAEIFLRSRLFEIINSSIQNESYDLALKQSIDFEQVKSAKMLYHWNHFMVNLVIKLAQQVDKK